MCAVTVALNVGFKALPLGLVCGQLMHFGGCLVSEDFYAQEKAMQGCLALEWMDFDLETLGSSLYHLC